MKIKQFFYHTANICKTVFTLRSSMNHALYVVQKGKNVYQKFCMPFLLETKTKPRPRPKVPRPRQSRAGLEASRDQDEETRTTTLFMSLSLQYAHDVVCPVSGCWPSCYFALYRGAHRQHRPYYVGPT